MASLVLAEQHTTLALSKQEEGFHQNRSPLLVDPIEKKLFEEFKIKTKFMKPKVK